MQKVGFSIALENQSESNYYHLHLFYQNVLNLDRIALARLCGARNIVHALLKLFLFYIKISNKK